MGWGTLYVVATPLGHLGDLTARAAEVLRRVPLVAAEDTRRTRGLLSHLDAHPRTISYHAHSDPGRREALLEHLRAGEDLALVSDAGTPGISDPGTDLVAAVQAAGGTVVPVPGPSAVTAALSAAGLPADRFLFLGFLPRRGADRRRLLAQAAGSPWTVVCFEAANRLVGLLEDLRELAGDDRTVVVARETTKLHEEFRRGSVAEQLAHWRSQEPRGEVTLLLAGAEPASDLPDEGAAEERARVLRAEGCSARDAAARLVEEFGLSRNAAYRLATGQAP